MNAEKTLEFTAERRKELHDQHAAASTKLEEARRELSAIEREQKALNALERALKPESAGARSPPAEIRQSILGAIAARPGGLTASEIVAELGARGNKTRQDAIRNALHAMKKPRGGKAAELSHEDGRYSLPIAKNDQAAGQQTNSNVTEVRSNTV